MTTTPPASRFAAVVLAAMLSLVPSLRGDEPPAADALLKLIPPDAGAVLALDDLRSRWGEIAEMRPTQAVLERPTVRGWLDSRGAGDFFEASDRVMRFLGTSWAEVRDDLLGDAVILAVLIPESPTLDASQARGLLALKARRPDLLKSLVNRINQAQQLSGELIEIADIQRGGVSYHVRRYPKDSRRLPEFYVSFSDGVFVFSNAEPPIQEAIDRKVGETGRGPSFVDSPGFLKASELLVDRPLARMYLAPALVAQTLRTLPSSPDPNAKKILKAARNYLKAMDVAAFGLTVDKSKVQVQIVQAFHKGAAQRVDDSAFAPFQLNVDRLGPGPLLMAPPPTAVGVMFTHMDFPFIYKQLTSLVPEADRGRLAKLESIAGALLLGQDLRDRILPALGPRAVVYVDAPAEPDGVGPFLPLVAAIEINDETSPGDRSDGRRPSTSAAVDNALRAVLTAVTLDPKRAPIDARIVDQDGVVSLNSSYPLAFSTGTQGRRIIVGTSRAAVARYMAAGARPNAGARFLNFRERAFPDFQSYACVDLAAMQDLAARYKDRLVAAASHRRDRPTAEVARDLDQILDLIHPFDAAYITGRVDERAEVIENRLGLIPSQSPATPATP